MTKRILAVVMALVLSLSMLSVNVFAADLTASISLSGTTVTVTVGAQDGATSYVVNLYKDGSNAVYQTRSLTAAGSVQFANLPSGSYSARVTANDAKGVLKTVDTSSVSIPNSGTTASGTITYSGTTGTIDVSWTAVSGTGVVYEITANYRNTNGTTGSLRNTADGTTSTKFALGDATLTSISITYTVGTGARQTYGTVNVNAGGTGGNPTTGRVNISGTTLYWDNNGTSYAYITAYSPTAGNLLNRYNAGVTTNYNFASLAARYSTIYFTVENYYNGVWSTIGTATYNANSNTGYGSFYVTVSYNGTATVNWASYTGATGYLIQVTGTSTSSYNTSGNTYTIPYTYGTATTVTVYATYGNSIIGTIGTATIDAYGNVTYNGGSYQGGYNQGAGANTVTGNNCYLVVGPTSSTLTWYGNYGTYCTVLYTVNGVTSQAQAYNNTATIPVGASTSFTVMVISNQQLIASASYTATTATTPGSSANKTTITNLTLTAKSSSTTTVSWEKVPGATMYEVDYVRMGANVVEPIYTTANSVDIPFGKASAFEVYVYAYINGRVTTVGSAIHLAGDEYETKKEETKPNNPETKPAETKPAYVTNFKGTVGTSGSITLSWSAASGSPTYEIYYKKTSASTWKKVYSTTSRSLKINKLTNGTSYDFKVVANGRDSGILTMTIGTTSSTKTAADPGSSSTSATPSISSISGGKGTITLSWNAVSGANLYRVYIAEDGSTTYKTKTTSWSTNGTSITLSGVNAGTYKVRIKVSTDNGKTWTSLADCDYRTVTVS